MKKLKLSEKRAVWAAQREKQKPVFKGNPLAVNAGVQAQYVVALTSLVAQMTAQVKREIVRSFKTDSAKAHYAMDASLASEQRILTNQLAEKFNNLFGKKAKPLAENMVDNTDKASAASLKSSLEKLSGGMKINASGYTRLVNEVYTASIAENVGLIKSISSQYLNQVQGSVMRSITTGRGLEDLIPELEKYEGMTHRRAKNIALDQTRKAYANITAGRLGAVGVKKYEWMHSGGGLHPREEHMEMDGNIYSFAEPPIIDAKTGERGIPGQAVNCRCKMRPVLDFGGDE